MNMSHYQSKWCGFILSEANINDKKFKRTIWLKISNMNDDEMSKENSNETTKRDDGN